MPQKTPGAGTLSITPTCSLPFWKETFAMPPPWPSLQHPLSIYGELMEAWA